MKKHKPSFVILAVLAHPDDESFGMGGTLAYYAHKNVQVHLVCATRGEAGKVDPVFLKNYASIAELREAELHCAAQHLGLTSVNLLNYRDSGMSGSPDNQHPQALAAAPLETVIADIVHYIRKLRPHVVLTFDPIGGYRHPDHIAIHQATVRAFSFAGDSHYAPGDLPPFSPQKLYFHNIPRAFLRIMVRLLLLARRDPSRFGANGDIDLLSISRDHFPTHAMIHYHSAAHYREKAAACHASQGGGKLNRGITGLLQRIAARDTFMRAYPEPNGKVEKDLLEGLVE